VLRRDLVSDVEAAVLPSLTAELATPSWCEAVGAAAEALGPDAESRRTRELALQAMLALKVSTTGLSLFALAAPPPALFPAPSPPPTCCGAV
jgi:hypothetical protein